VGDPCDRLVTVGCTPLAADPTASMSIALRRLTLAGHASILCRRAQIIQSKRAQLALSCQRDQPFGDFSIQGAADESNGKFDWHAVAVPLPQRSGI
jgi:hypothetical protein